MSNDTHEQTKPPRRWPKRVAIGSACLLVVGWLGFLLLQSRSDGPMNDIIPGGALRSGELVTAPVTDWSFADGKTVELQLVTPTKSRWVGMMSYQGELFIPCDLGYMWGRMEGRMRDVLQLIYRVKRWHKDALADGRVVVRVDNKRYPFNATLVTNAKKITGLKSHLEELAKDWVAPDELGPPPTEGPRDIWFFRLQQRGAG